MVAAKGLCSASTSSRRGMPVTSRIMSSWFMVEDPGKTGLPTIISPKMHPALHKSTSWEYRLDPSMISGALYHLVAT
eukprot:CAMPEP_0204500544 /NCGR_PEP_ID=MMETSP0471-20130131/97403_1 /ASSEMBLY_ACC=CAM_ASM_000602 /TAXON_ID=2969 /ORGANISM="Oxyrrhis marina" /LENGTH=76 /DNA_ID=CAMNT_0051505169 /DNA_START=458 /DNA_END=688 /DNA_ORIENTATION=-